MKLRGVESERLLLIPGLAPVDSNCVSARSVVDPVEAQPQRTRGNENALNCESCYGKKSDTVSSHRWIRACKKNLEIKGHPTHHMEYFTCSQHMLHISHHS